MFVAPTSLPHGDLSLKANRTIFALNNKIKISKLPRRLALKLFNSQITPILLYGSEVWGPYMNYDYLSWELSKIERVQTQFLKRMLGCNIQTSNIMTRGEVIKRVVCYTFFLYKQLHFQRLRLRFGQKLSNYCRNIKDYQTIIAWNDRAHSEQSFKHVFVVGVTLVFSPFWKNAKQLRGWTRKWSCL